MREKLDSNTSKDKEDGKFHLSKKMYAHRGVVARESDDNEDDDEESRGLRNRNYEDYD
jgi:hypothetical protein